MLTISMFAHRSTVELSKQRQRAAEGKQETMGNTGSHLMAADLTESTAGRALKEQRMLMSEIM